MEQHKSEIKLSPKSWHAKLIKWVFGFKTSDFKNLCPYFWLLVASIFLVIPVTPLKLIFLGLSWIFGKFEGYIESEIEKSFEDMPKEISDGERYILYAYFSGDDDLKRSVCYGEASKIKDRLETKITKISRNRKGLRDLYDLLPANKSWKKLKISLDHEIQERREIRRRIEQREKVREQKKKRQKELIAEITNATKDITKFLACLSIVALGYCFCYVLTMFVSWICFVPFSNIIDFFYILVAILLGILIASIVIWASCEIHEWWKVKESKTTLEWVILSPVFLISVIVRGIKWLLWDILVIKFLGGIAIGVRAGFMEYGGIFAEYLNASYSDYCPGINWED